MDFIKELHEARMTRNAQNQRQLTYTDCKERAFLTMLMLLAMRYYRSHRDRAATYARKTVMYRDYSKFRQDGTDLYNLFYFILGNDDAIGKLKDPGTAKQQRAKTFLSIRKVNVFLRNTSTSKQPAREDIVNLRDIENELDIKNSDYKDIRRYLSVFADITQVQRKQIITRLIFAARSKLTDSDFIADFTKLTLDQNLEDFNAASPEPEINVLGDADLTNVINYRFLLDPNTLPFVNRFLQASRSGRAVVSNLVQAYLPIIIMIDDIVRAGPAYINQLKIIHNRAKRHLKK